jgi:hypothetical protein
MQWSARVANGRTVLTVSDPISRADAARLKLLLGPTASLVVDLREVTFLGPAGLDVLADAASRFATQPWPLAIVTVSATSRCCAQYRTPTSSGLCDYSTPLSRPSPRRQPRRNDSASSPSGFPARWLGVRVGAGGRLSRVVLPQRCAPPRPLVAVPPSQPAMTLSTKTSCRFPSGRARYGRAALSP